jgi:hypothetical protein
VVCQRAPKAEPMLAVAHHRRYDAAEISLLNATLDSVLAVRGRTPLKIFLVVHVCAHEEFVIAIGKIWRDQQVERLRVHDRVAAVSRTLNPRGFALFLDLLIQILSVAVDTKSVPTFHSKGLKSRTVLAANVAHEVVNGLDARRARAHVLPKARLTEHLLLVVHVLFDQAFLVPAEVSQQYRR